MKILHLSREQRFDLFYLMTMFSTIAVLSFSQPCHVEKLLFCLTLLTFLSIVLPLYRKDPLGEKKRLSRPFFNMRFVWIIFTAYLIWDLYLLLYAKDYHVALKKLPQYANYILLIPMGIYFCSSYRHIRYLFLTVAVMGTTVSVGAYIAYFCFRRPHYFQRLSTASDYNVFAAVVFVGFLFAVSYLLYFSKKRYRDRLLIAVVLSAFNMPVLYLAGSRRMIVMLPFFFLFAVIYECVHFRHEKNATLSIFGGRALILVVCAVFYMASTLLAVPFSQYGVKKQIAWNKYVAEQKIKAPSGKGPGGAPDNKEEATIENVLETISSGSMTNRRRLIYAVATKELFHYSLSDWLIGRGASYDIYLFDHTHDQALLKSYKYSEEHRPDSGWMCAHNFVFADLLNGGIVKLILSLLLIGGMLTYIIKITAHDPRYGMPLIISFALMVTNNFISGAFGFLNDVFFALNLTLLFAVWYQIKAKGGKSDEPEKCLHHDECASA